MSDGCKCPRCGENDPDEVIDWDDGKLCRSCGYEWDDDKKRRGKGKKHDNDEE